MTPNVSQLHDVQVFVTAGFLIYFYCFLRDGNSTTSCIACNCCYVLFLYSICFYIQLFNKRLTVLIRLLFSVLLDLQNNRNE